MIKKTIKYVDFNGNENEETFYFHLSKQELAFMELGKPGGLSNYIKEAVESGDTAGLLETFDDVIVKSYGIKSEDGKRFVKNKTIQEEFKQSAAYGELFIQIATAPEEAEAFIKGVVS